MRDRIRPCGRIRDRNETVRTAFLPTVRASDTIAHRGTRNVQTVERSDRSGLAAVMKTRARIGNAVVYGSTRPNRFEKNAFLAAASLSDSFQDAHSKLDTRVTTYASRCRRLDETAENRTHTAVSNISMTSVRNKNGPRRLPNGRCRRFPDTLRDLGRVVRALRTVRTQEGRIIYGNRFVDSNSSSARTVLKYLIKRLVQKSCR